MASWSDLPQDLLRLVVAGLVSPADCARFRAVCRPWRSFLRMPWVVLPNRLLLRSCISKVVFFLKNTCCVDDRAAARAEHCAIGNVSGWFEVRKVLMKSPPIGLIAVRTNSSNYPIILVQPGKGVWFPEPHTTIMIPIMDIAFLHDKLYGIRLHGDLISLCLAVDSRGAPTVSSMGCVINHLGDVSSGADVLGDEHNDATSFGEKRFARLALAPRAGEREQTLAPPPALPSPPPPLRRRRRVPPGVARAVPAAAAGHSPRAWQGGAALGVRGGVPRLGAGPARPGGSRGGGAAPAGEVARRRRTRSQRAGCRPSSPHPPLGPILVRRAAPVRCRSLEVGASAHVAGLRPYHRSTATAGLAEPQGLGVFRWHVRSATAMAVEDVPPAGGGAAPDPVVPLLPSRPRVWDHSATARMAS
ncbi:hypothetical protein QYE76_071503 [Lolium multiflorum]|uniref:F-box domain-containing protein n=1 Tax=Lolium multiflorum TaxID=4521 RepID=A0AAD8SLP9_LOLMU|nr:hypothetical protein QYE76_071503 [Lolium multiflorum]